MFIQTEETPNPSTLKFLPGRVVLEKGARQYTIETDYKESPLACQLFGIEGVKGVFLGNDFISVTKDAAFDWSILKTFVLTQIMEFFLKDQPVVIADHSHEPESFTDEDPVSAQIRSLLDTKIRPAVAMDGGDIIFDHFHDGIVYLKMQGACAGCPSSTATLKSGIENMLRHYVPEVLEVRAL